jgi:hypothetical protein
MTLPIVASLWQQPNYYIRQVEVLSSVGTTFRYTVAECSVCGTVVNNQQRHTQWHIELATQVQSIAQETKTLDAKAQEAINRLSIVEPAQTRTDKRLTAVEDSVRRETPVPSPSTTTLPRVVRPRAIKVRKDEQHG